MVFLLHIVSAGAATSKITSSPTCLLPQLRWLDYLVAGQASVFLPMASPWPAWVISQNGHLRVV